jgi:hypothetical protein
MLNKMVQSPTNPSMYVRRGPDNAPPGLGTNFWDGQKGWPCQQPPWGELIAVNVNTGDIAWRRPLGSFEELDRRGVPETGTLLRGGPIVTATGVVFIGASQDAKFRAFDVRSGKILWTTDISENGRTVPITYEGRSGKQYVAILAGGGRPVGRSVDVSQIGGRLHVYSLPDPGARDLGPVARRIRTADTTAASSAPATGGAGPAAAAVVNPARGRLGAVTTSAARGAGSGVSPVGRGGSGAAARAARSVASLVVLPEGKDRALVERLCTECHDLEQTVLLRQSRERWSALVDDMVGRGAPGSDAELALVVDYLSSNFGPK